MYHYVRPLKGSKYPNLKALEISEFRKQLKWFKNKFDIINYDDLIDILKNRKISKKKKIILSFDDGYKDHYEYVLPELKKNNISGFFYPPSKVVENEFVLDVNKIHFILERIQDRKKILKDINLILEKNNFKNIYDMNISLNILKTRYDDLETSLIKKLLQYILPKKLRLKIINNLLERYLNLSIKEFSKELYINSQDLKEMYDEGMHFGSHGEFHERWGLLSKNKQKKEMKNSIGFLKKIGLNKDRLSVCYPYGSYNKDTLNCVNDFNFNFGLTTNVGGVSNKHLKNKFELPRFNANDFIL